MMAFRTGVADVPRFGNIGISVIKALMVSLLLRLEGSPLNLSGSFVRHSPRGIHPCTLLIKPGRTTPILWILNAAGVI